MKRSTLTLIIGVAALFLIGSAVLAGILLSMLMSRLPELEQQSQTVLDRSQIVEERRSRTETEFVEIEDVESEVVTDWGVFDFVDEEDDYSMALYWPETDSAEVNTEINLFIEDAIEEFRGVYNAFPPTPGYGSYAVEIDWSAATASETSSVVFSEYWYTGGAHPAAYTRTWTWDNTSKRILSLTDVFGADALQRVSDASRRQLLEDEWTSADDEWFLEGTEPIEENYQAWWIDGDTLYVQFQQYQIAAYAAGAPTVEILINELQ